MTYRILRRPTGHNSGSHPWWTVINAPHAVCDKCGAALRTVVILEDGTRLGLDCAGVAQARTRVRKSARAMSGWRFVLESDGRKIAKMLAAGPPRALRLVALRRERSTIGINNDPLLLDTDRADLLCTVNSWQA